MGDIIEKMRVAHAARKPQPVKVPEYGETWYFPVLTVAESDRIGQHLPDDVSNQMATIEMIVQTAIYEDGNKVFPDTGEARTMLKDLSTGVAAEISAIVQVSVGDTKAAKND